MAAGKHGGYRGNEFTLRESVLEFKGRDFGYSKPEPRRYRCGERALVHDIAFERREWCEREREKPTYSESRAREEKRGSQKGYYHSSSSGGNSGVKGVRKGQSGVSDRELGELSGGSGSDGSVVVESQLVVKGVTKWNNGVELPPAKKQKLSPVVWDRENKQENKSTIVNYHGISVSKSSGFGKDSMGSSCLLDQEQHWSNDEEMGELEDEDVVRTWNIAGSRWADEEEGEIFTDEDVPKRKKKSSATRSTKISSPDLEDLTSQVSEGIRENNYLDELSKNDDMDVDKEISNSTCPYYSDDSERENDSYGSAEPFSPPRSVNMLQGCRSVLEFERLGRVSEGTYGVVFKARDTRNGDIVALKKVKMEKEREGFPLTALREINILLSSHHPSIVDVKEVVMGDHLDQIFMVMEYMEHDLKGYMETMKRRFTSGEVKCLMLQLLEGVKYLHDNWILHRDLKTSNLLLNNEGELKICDFGLSRQYGSPPKPYTPLVVTLWYRAPELLLKAKQYSTAIDMWSAGCIMAELLAKTPLFGGTSEVDQLDKIFRTLGTPTEKIWPGFSKLPGVKVNFVKNQKNLLREKFPSACFTGRDPVLSEAGFDLLSRFLAYNPEERITAEEAVNHEWFYEDPLPISKFDMPAVPSQHARNR